LKKKKKEGMEKLDIFGNGESLDMVEISIFFLIFKYFIFVWGYLRNIIYELKYWLNGLLFMHFE
jgi:hypothetical protein